jgi:probable rRNA maturation factor
VFCDNVFIRKLNRKFFKKSNPTDVISFPLHDTINPDYLGEIVISAEQAKKICNFYGKRWQEELVLYLIHGVLHLIGYNDINKKERARMERKQEEIFAKLLKRYRKAIFDIG